MKIYSNPLNRWMALLGIGCLLSVLFSSCLKSKNDYTPPAFGLCNIFTIVTGQVPLDLYFNSNKSTRHRCIMATESIIFKPYRPKNSQYL